MDLKKSLLTTDEKMEDLEDGDVTTNIIGFVHAVTAPVVSDKRNELLFKFVLSNGSDKRICVLVWGNKLIDKYFTEIQSNRVININGAQCRAVANSKYREANNLVPCEIIIRENTSVTFHGNYSIGEQATCKIQKVTFDTIHTVEGLVEIGGYVRTPFALMHNRTGLMTYGLSAITDGRRKITVQVKQFQRSNLQIGDFIIVQGTVKGQDSLVTIFWDDMGQIKYDPEITAMSAEAVQHGGRAVKRVQSKENQVNN